jgi:hypothetical protein
MGDDFLHAKVFPDRMTSGDWRVECVIEDAQVEVAIFSGPNARERALQHADRAYGDFEEISRGGPLEPRPA